MVAQEQESQGKRGVQFLLYGHDLLRDVLCFGFSGR